LALIASASTSRFQLTRDLHPGYKLRRLRGRGGFGEVWEADNERGGVVALKFLPCPKGQGAAQELRSIQVVQGLAHPHLTRIDRVWCAGGYVVVAMELADGSLADLLEVYQAEVGTPLPPSHVLPLLAQAAAALDYLNNQQHLISGQWLSVQHCDVTPANLLLFGQTIKLSDFGLTTTLAGRDKVHCRAGTPAFAAPEIFEGRLTQRSDQYGLAMCYCQLRGGRLPFADEPSNFQVPHGRGAPQLDMLDAVERAPVARALATFAQDRWTSCSDLIAELQRCTAPPSGPASRPDQRRHTRYSAGVCVQCEVRATLGNDRWRAQVQNISVAGARLRLTTPGCDLKPGRVLELVLTAAGGLRCVVRLRLAHATEQPGGDYEVGGAFDSALTSAELAALAAAPPPAS
jgi:serine/threonine protein kinase